MEQYRALQFKKTTVVAIQIAVHKTTKMKKHIISLLLIGLALFVACTPPESSSKKDIIIKKSNIVKRSVGVNGMTCVGCEVTLEDQVSKIEGVVSVKASHTDSKAVIEFDTTKTNLHIIKKIIKEAGYQSY